MKVRLFTDGACSENPGPGGWAIAINTSSKCHTFSGNEKLTTNNRMELRAVIEAFRKIVNKKKHRENVEYEIHSDSAYVVNTINNNWLDVWKYNNWQTTKQEDVKNKDMWEEFDELRTKARVLGLTIRLIKIKGHSGNSFNELVDKLAKAESLKAKGR